MALAKESRQFWVVLFWIEFVPFFFLLCSQLSCVSYCLEIQVWPCFACTQVSLLHVGGTCYKFLFRIGRGWEFEVVFIIQLALICDYKPNSFLFLIERSLLDGIVYREWSIFWLIPKAVNWIVTSFCFSLLWFFNSVFSSFLSFFLWFVVQLFCMTYLFSKLKDGCIVFFTS